MRRATNEEMAAGRPPVRCGDRKLGEVAADDNWKWAFRFAIELATHIPIGRAARPSARVSPDRERTLASLAELFLPRGRGQGRRPTELIYRAWHLFEVDRLVLRELGLSVEEGRRLVLPGAEQVVAHYRNRRGRDADLIEHLLQRGFARCPPDGSRAEFLMGSRRGYTDERPQHTVSLQVFEVQSTPVTRAQYRVFDPELEQTEATGLELYSLSYDCPAVYVSWYDAFACAKFLGAEFGLPSETQWECACRAGSTSLYFFGDWKDELGEYAWYDEYSDNIKHAVGEKKPNAWGLYDMLGNVFEWCWDWYGAYSAEPASDPAGPDTGEYRVRRGGGWYFDDRPPRSADRDSGRPGGGEYDRGREYYLGFRVSRALTDKSGTGAQPEAWTCGGAGP